MSRGASRGQASAMDTVEAIESRLRELVYRRQRLRELGAGPGVLERNRRRIVQEQWALSHALIARYRPHAA